MTQLHDRITDRPISDAETELLRRLHEGSLTEIEVAWSDPFAEKWRWPRPSGCSTPAGPRPPPGR